MQVVEMDLRNLVCGNFLARLHRCWLIRAHSGTLVGGEDNEREVSFSEKKQNKTVCLKNICCVLSRVFSISDIPWFVEVQHHPDSVPCLVDLFDVILAGDFHNLSEHVLQLSGLPLGKTLLPTSHVRKIWLMKTSNETLHVLLGDLHSPVQLNSSLILLSKLILVLIQLV